MDFFKDNEIAKKIKAILTRVNLPYLDHRRIVCFKSFGSKSRAIARIWSLPKIWQQALDIKPHYCIEVIAQRFDKLSEDEKTKVLIHELLHIPKNFSGALLPHRSRKRYGINKRNIEEIFGEYKNSYK